MLWLIVSILLLMHLNVFAAKSLAHAPARRSNLSMLTVAAVVLLYIGLLAATQVGLGLFYRPSHSASASRPSAVTLPTTTSAPATTSSAATEEQPQEDPHLAMILQIADAFTKFLPALVILALTRKLVVGSIDGWGLSLRKIPQGIAYGLLGLLVIYPLLVVLNIIVSSVIEHFQHRVEEAHETLQLLARPDISPWERITFIAVAGLFAPVLEEIFFRGLLQTVFIEKGWGFRPKENSGLAAVQTTASVPRELTAAPHTLENNVLSYESKGMPVAYDRRFVRQRWLAILATSFIFAGIHLMPDSFVVLFALAIGLGYLYERTGNLWACITLHAAFNCLNIYLYTRS